MNESASPILRLLGERSLRGDGPVTYRALAHALGAHERVVRLAYRELTLQGYPILCSSDSTEGGIYLCREPGLIREAARKLEHRGVAILDRARALRETADRLERESGEPQPSLFSGGQAQGIGL